MTEVKETPEQIATRLLRRDVRQLIAVQMKLRKRLLAHGRRLTPAMHASLAGRVSLEHDKTATTIAAIAPEEDPE